MERKEKKLWETPVVNALLIKAETTAAISDGKAEGDPKFPNAPGDYAGPSGS